MVCIRDPPFWPLLFAIMVDVITESVRNGLMSEMLYADDLALTSETMEGLREKFWKWKEAFESKGLKVNIGKTKVVVTKTLTLFTIIQQRFPHLNSKLLTNANEMTDNAVDKLRFTRTFMDIQ